MGGSFRDALRKGFWRVGICILAIGMCLSYGVRILWKIDAPAPDDAWLRPMWKPITARDGNPLMNFQDWLDSHPLKGSEIDLAVLGDDARLGAILVKYDAHLHQVDRLLASDSATWLWREGPASSEPDTEVQIEEFEKLAELLEFRSRAAAGVEQAVKYATEILLFSSGTARAQGGVIHLIASCRLQISAVRALQSAVTRPGTSDEMLAAVQASLEKAETGADSAAFAQRVNYEFFRNIVLAAGKLDTQGLLKPHRALREFAKLHRPLILTLDQGWGGVPAVLARHEAAIRDFNASNRVRIWSGGGAGSIMVDLGCFAASGCLSSVIDGNTFVALACAQIGLRRHELRTGALPKSLAELQPAMTTEGLSDPWSNRMLVWQRESRRLYSVGKNGSDENGDAGDDLGGAYWWSAPSGNP
jgi:hypothetical protein